MTVWQCSLITFSWCIDTWILITDSVCNSNGSFDQWHTEGRAWTGTCPAKSTMFVPHMSRDLAQSASNQKLDSGDLGTWGYRWPAMVWSGRMMLSVHVHLNLLLCMHTMLFGSSLVPKPFLCGRGERGEGRKGLVNNSTLTRIPSFPPLSHPHRKGLGTKFGSVFMGLLFQ